MKKIKKDPLEFVDETEWKCRSKNTEAKILDGHYI